MKSSSDKAGGQLLQELEALSQALYKSQSIPTSLPGNIPPPRREFDHINHRRRVSEAAGRPPKSAAPAGSSLESRHSISGILPSQDRKLTSTIAGDIIPDAYQQQEEQHEDHHQESSIDLTHKKKGGIWSWKPLRALAHIGQHRLHCEFSAHIHGIEKLPGSMNGLRLQIHLRHRDTGVHTQPARVSSGAAEFEEVLHFRCSVYASKSKSSIKYMSKSFTLSAIAADIEELDLGKHQLDLTRILPSNALPAPGSEHSSTSSWNTSFKLSGKARGGVLWVTFSYQILENGGGSAVGRTESGRFGNVGIGSRSFNSLPSSPHTGNLHGKQPVKEFGSPARSEPGNEYGDMEHLDLDHDELPRSKNGGKSNSNLNSNLDSGGALNLWKPPLPGRGSTRAIDVVEHRGKPLFETGIAPGTPGRVEEQQQPVEKVEDEGVFSVVERGVETSALDEQDRSVFEEQKDDEQEEEDGGEKQEEEEEEETQEQVVHDQVKEDGDLDQELKQRYQADEQIDDEQDQDDQEQEEEQAEEEQEEEQEDDQEVAEAQQEHEEQAPEEQEEEENDDEDEEEYKQEELPVEVKVGLEQYDWKRELEEDDLYDSLRSPGMLSSSSSATPENYWKEQEEQTPPPAPAPAPQKDEYRFEYQSDGDSEDEAGKVDVKDGDEEDELVADEFLDMLSGAPALAASPPDNLGSNDLLHEYSVESSDAEPLQKYEVEEDDDDEVEPDSPRALLLKQFEQEAMLEGGFGLDAEEEEVAAQLSFGSPIVPAFNLDEDEEPLGRHTLQHQQSPISSEASSPQQQQQKQPDHTRVSSEEWNSDEDKELAAIMDAAESELQKATQAMKSKARAKMLEDAEAEALLQEWGLDENVFHDEDQPPTAAGAHPEEPQGTESSIVLRQGVPPLAPGIGSSVPTADGGTLRSMDTSHFQNGKNDGKLVMHVSKPVVVPAEMGATAIDVLRNLAAAGTENMAAEAMAAMPLEDITGKSVQQIALEGQACYDESSRRYDAALIASNRYALEGVGVGAGALAAPGGSSALYLPKQRNAPRQQNGEFLQLDELAPVAMEKIEELAMQGLKIQCDVADEDAPYVIDPAQNLPQLTGSGSTSRLLLEGGSSEGSSDGMIAMSLSLDEWMRLDAGLDDDEQASDKSRAIMAAHREAHSTTDLVLNLTGEQKPSSSSGSSAGFGKMGDTLTLAMLVQLRDPLRNYEPVGAPMMALVEAERVLVPPKPKLWKRVALKGNSEAEYNDEVEEEKPADPQPQFKITGVHMAGLNVQEDIKDPKKKNQLWGNQRQQQSGSRWLVANGMAKSVGSKHPLLKSSKPSKSREGASLWSISARPEVESSKPLTRNPDVKFGRLAAAGGFRKR